ncbi:hypothetical protein [Pseudomonas sp. 210_17 TE3656]
MTLSLSEEDFQAILDAGNWKDTAEDHETFYKEQIPAALVQRWVQAFDPAIIESTAGLAALTLATSTAAWGVTPVAGLPADPEGKEWKGPRKGNDGKHLMSYAVGGIGLDHTDSSSLVDLIDYLKENHPNLAPEADRFFELRGINFDRIRANGGVCVEPRAEITLDLDGAPFGHSKYGGGDSYCRDFRKGNTTLEDWRIFRHWMRAALRTREIQRLIIERWINRVWVPSYKAVMSAGGSVEDAMVNSRIRNSSPATAKCALGKAAGAVDRIQAQLDAYSDPDINCGGKKRHVERWGVMRRPVVLYRHFRGID